MEFLGYFEGQPVVTESGKWDFLELRYPDEYAYNDAICKIFKSIKNNEHRFIVANKDTTRFLFDLLDVRFDTQKTTVRIWPHYFKQAKR